jgi:hypothetical protein
MVKVIYIAGSTRSGSTLLGSILGQVEGVFFLPAKFIESGIRETARLVYVVVARRKRNAKCGLLSLRMHLVTLIKLT